MADSKVLDNLFQDGVLVDLSIGFWSARKRNDEADLGLDPGDIPEYVIGLGTKRLIPREYTDDWTSISSRARGAVKRYSFQFPLGGAAFVPLQALTTAEDRLTALKAEFTESTGSFLKDFDGIKATFLRSLSKADRKRIEPEIPPADVVKGKFYFTWSTYVVALPKKLRIIAADAKARAAQEKMQQDAALRIQRELTVNVEAFIERAVRTLHTKVAASLDAIAVRVREGHAVTDRSLDVVRRAVEQFRSLNIFGNTRLNQQLSELEKELLEGVDAAAYEDDENLGRRLGRQCAAIAQAALSVSDINAVTGQYNRRILLKKDDAPAA